VNKVFLRKCTVAKREGILTLFKFNKLIGILGVATCNEPSESVQVLGITLYPLFYSTSMNPEEIVVLNLIFTCISEYIADQKLWMAVRKRSLKNAKIIGNSV